jgi:hypothetical protein
VRFSEQAKRELSVGAGDCDKVRSKTSPRTKPMRRVGRNGLVSLQVQSPASPAGSERSSRLRIADLPPVEAPAIQPASDVITTSACDVKVSSSDPHSERLQRLARLIEQRIEVRLPGRVRHLSVRVSTDFVVLEGECSTYYTKQLAQHAALGVLEDEHLENAIVVTIGR